MLIKSGSNLELVIFSIPFHLDRSASSYQFEKYLNIFQCSVLRPFQRHGVPFELRSGW